MSSIITRGDGLEMAFCECCGNYVPTVEDGGDLFCAYEYAEYPDIATIVGQCQWSLVVFSQMKEEQMSKEQMVKLIRQVWSDAMSDNGAIWAKSNLELEKAKAQYPDVYAEALPIAYERGML